MIKNFSKLKESSIIKIVIFMHSVLFFVKIIIGFFSGSIAVISDGIHSGVDVFTTLVIGFATKISKEKADSEHQFGHGKAKSIAALFIAIIAGITGFEIAKYGFEKLFTTEPLKDIGFTIFILIGAIIFSGIISFLMTFFGKKYKNSAMIASGKETVGDVFFSFSILIGLIIIYFFEIYWVDPVLAIFIGIMIIKIGYNIAMENVDILMGARASDGELIEIQEVIFKNFPKIKAIHDIYTQKLSENEIYLSMHCEISLKDAETMDFKKTHDLGEQIEAKLTKLAFVSHVIIHLDYENDFIMNRIINKN